MRPNKTTLKPGETMFEVLISLAVLAVLTTGVFTLLPTQFAQQEQIKDADKAYALAEEGLQAARAIRDKAWTSITAGNHGVALQVGTWSFLGAEDVTDGIYHRVVAVTDVSATQKQVVATVSWQGRALQQRSVHLATQLTNWRNATTGQVWGDWHFPIVAGSVDLGPGNQGMGIAVKNKIIYAAAKASPVSKPDLYTIDAHDGNHPYVLGSINTGEGLTDVAVSGTWAFATTENQSDKLQVFDVSDASNPTLRSQVTVSNAVTYPVSIALDGHYAYVGSLLDNLGEFGIFNISNPLAPSLAGSLKVQADVNSVAIKGNRAYLATSKDNAEILIVDISNPASPSVVGQLDIPGNGDANDVYFDLKQNRAFVSRQAEGAASNPEIAILDISAVNSPSIIGSIQSNTGVLAAIESGNLVFASCDVSNAEFQVFSVQNLASPEYWSSVNYPQTVGDMALEDNVVYVAVRSNDAIKILTAQ